MKKKLTCSILNLIKFANFGCIIYDMVLISSVKN